jgi:hypothetical protein
MRNIYSYNHCGEADIRHALPMRNCKRSRTRIPPPRVAAYFCPQVSGPNPKTTAECSILEGPRICGTGIKMFESGNSIRRSKARLGGITESK